MIISLIYFIYGETVKFLFSVTENIVPLNIANLPRGGKFSHYVPFESELIDNEQHIRRKCDENGPIRKVTEFLILLE